MNHGNLKDNLRCPFCHKGFNTKQKNRFGSKYKNSPIQRLRIHYWREHNGKK